MVALTRAGRASADRRLLEQALAIVRELDRSGRLRASDRGYLESIPRAIDSLR